MNSRNIKMPATQYYEIVADRQAYKGERYFALVMGDERVMQVCLSQGDDKKGRGHTVGLYFINRLTFLSNYLACGYVHPITKRKFKEKYELVEYVLRTAIN